MGGNSDALTGPDFALGVAESMLAPNESKQGHAFGESVLLARVGDEYFAVGANCTHYGAPLADGVVHGDTVRCPWHHACFSLRNGEALRAPALAPIASYTVERRDGLVFVGRKTERDVLAPTYPKSQVVAAPPTRVLIVGAGAAGSAAAEMLRRSGYDGRITMIDGESDSPYDRPNLSKDYLAGNAPEEWIPLRPSDFYSRHNINVIRAQATRLDVVGKRVELAGRDAEPYDALLLATGAEPIHLGLPGEDQPHVHVVRSLADTRALIANITHAKRAAVIGSSFIGLEVAASLRARGIDVHVVAPESIPLERVMGKEVGTFVRSIHEEHGVTFHLGRKPASIESQAVVLDDGSRIECDIVVLGVGVRPRLSLAQDAGLTIDRGVVVDQFLATNAPGVFAAGDIARWPDRHSNANIRVEHWVVAQRMGQTAARNMLGAREPFDAVPFFWSAHYDVTINYVGHAEQWDDVKFEGDIAARSAVVTYVKDGRSLAVVTIGNDVASLNAEIAMERSA